MAAEIAVDSNVVVDYMRGNAAAARLLENSPGVFAPSTVLGELLHGAEKSDRPAENLARVERFASRVTVVSVDRDTAYHYSAIKTSLVKKGRLIPENDMWIAAVARRHKLTLVTRDSHFDEVTDIGLLSW